MLNVSKIGLILSKREYRVDQVGIFGKSPIFTFLSLPPARGHGESFETILGENPYSVVCKREHCLPLSSLVL